MRPLVLAYLLVVLAAYEPAAQAPASAAARSISGHVIDTVNGTPLRRAQVVLVAGGTPIASTFTNDQGRFAVDDAPRRALTVRAAKAGYVPAVGAVPADGDAATLDLALALVRAAAIEGRVRSRWGGPLPGAYVAARRLTSDTDSEDIAGSRFFVASDYLGNYRLAGLPPGRYEVTALRIPPHIPRSGPLENLLFGSRASLETGEKPLAIALRSGDDRSAIDFTIDAASESCDRTAATGPSAPTDPSAAGAISGRVHARAASDDCRTGAPARHAAAHPAVRNGAKAAPASLLLSGRTPRIGTRSAAAPGVGPARLGPIRCE